MEENLDRLNKKGEGRIDNSGLLYVIRVHRYLILMGKKEDSTDSFILSSVGSWKQANLLQVLKHLDTFFEEFALPATIKTNWVKISKQSKVVT